MKMKRCLTLCGKATYVKGKNGRPFEGRPDRCYGELPDFGQITPVMSRLLSCEELARLTGRVALEEVRIGADGRVVERIRV